ncbi:MAG: LamG domain-containing protein [Patescibacteria group bacterium]|jgi:hypothetical protein
MHKKLNQLKADLKFWLWKTKTLNAKRYVSIVVLVAMLVGVSIYSLGGIIKKVAAANAASVNLQTGSITVDGGNFLLDSNKCLWTTDSTSTISVVQKDGSNLNLPYNFKGKVCFDGVMSTPTTPQDVIVQNGGVLSLMGSHTFKTLTVNSGGTVTHPPADANGKAVPYGSRSFMYAMRFTFFVKVEAPAGDPTNIKRVYLKAPDSNDSIVIEAGGGALPGTSSVDDPAAFNLGLISWHANNGIGCNLMDASFRASSSCGGTLPAANFNTEAEVAVSRGGDSVRYVPIRVTTWQSTSDQFYKVGYRETLQIGAGAETQIANNPQYLPISYIYGPYEGPSSESGTLTGAADPAAQYKSRFEYAQAPIDQADYSSLGSNGWGLISKDLSTFRIWSSSQNRYVDQVAKPTYSFFSRVDLTNNGTFKDFGKYDCTGHCTNVNDAFYFDYNDPSRTSAGNPFSNSQRKDGYGYLIGANPGASTYDPLEPNVALLQNYKLQTHSDAAPVIKPSVTLHVTGAVTLNGGLIDTTNKGLPGGFTYGGPNNSDSKYGFAGVGGKGNSSPGWWYAYADCDNSNIGIQGSNWSDGNGGGGGPANKSCTDVIGLAGGGGGMGYGGSGKTYVDSNSDSVYNLNNTRGSYYSHGQGGAGLYGIGGGFAQNSGTGQYQAVANYDSMIHGYSYRERYTSSTAALLGGGGGGGTDAGAPTGVSQRFDDGSFPAGSGGGAILLTVDGDMTLSGNSTVSASGGNGWDVSNPGGGANHYATTSGGGGGSVILSVSGTINLANTSIIKANGGNTSGRCFASSGNECGVPGEGGGGLVRITASVFSGDGWIFAPNNYCDVNGAYVGILSNSVQAAAGRGTASGGSLVMADGSDAYGQVSEHGIVDLKYAGNIPFCGSGLGAGTGIQISKQIEQLSSAPAEGSAAVASANGNNVVTVTNGSILRVTITVSNLSTTNQTVTISDVLPKSTMTLGTTSPAVTLTSGLQFDGSNDYVVVPGNAGLRMTTLTLEGWINTTSGASSYPLNYGAYGFQINKWSSGGALSLLFTNQYGVGEECISNRSVNDGNWHHIAGTIDQANKKYSIYIDGALSKACTMNANIKYSSTESLYFGTGSPTVGRFNGKLNEIRVSNNLRYTGNYTPSNHFNTDANTIGLWHLDGVAGSTTATDSSSNGNNGTLMNGATNSPPANGSTDGPVWLYDPDTVIPPVNGLVYVYNSTSSDFTPTVSSGKFSQSGIAVAAGSYTILRYVTVIK